jgi:hypothetical protein
MILLNFLQGLKQAVVHSIGHFGRIECVVTMPMVMQQFAQILCARLQRRS